VNELTRRALARALVVRPEEGGPPLDPGADEVLDAVAGLLATLPRDERFGARLLLRFARYLPFFLGPVRGRLDRIPTEAARATLERLRLSRLRLLRYLFFCLKSIFAVAYFSRPAVWPAIGYDGPYLGRIPVTRLVPPRFASGPLPDAPPPPVELGPAA
jgi:hypothetical protein